MLRLLAKSIIKHITCRAQVDYLSQDAKRLASDMAALKALLVVHNTSVKDDWATYLLTHGITDSDLRRRYKNRQGIMGALAVIFVGLCFFNGLNFSLATLISCLIIAGFYIAHSFRLFQIRKRRFCPFTVYLHAALKAFKELLPLPLPKDWQPFATSKKG